MVSFPAISSKARKLTGNVAALNNQLVNMLKCAINLHMSRNLIAVSVFTCAGIFDPVKVVELEPTGSDVGQS